MKALRRKLRKWPIVLAKALKKAVPRSVLKRSMLNSTVTLSTQFSGMGTAERAANIVCRVAKRLRLKCKIRCLSATDIAPAAQKCLKTALHGGCLFTDMIKQVKVKDSAKFKRLSFVKKIRKIKRCKLRKRAWCLVHKKAAVWIICVCIRICSHVLVQLFEICFCKCSPQECRLQQADIVIAGTSCVDFSRAGKRRKENGPTIASTLCWFRRARKAKVWIHENVPDFPDVIPRSMMKIGKKASKPNCRSNADDVSVMHYTCCAPTNMFFLKAGRTHVIKKLEVETAHCGHGKLTSRSRRYRLGFSKRHIDMVRVIIV